MALYGWLIGSWEMDTLRHLDDGTIQKWSGECHFGWVLEGRAIQDIWIRPRRPAPSTMYGTTLRIFDPGIGAWHIIWNDPLNQDYSRQIGRAEGKDIVQIGDNFARSESSMAFHRDHNQQLPLDRRGKIIRERPLENHV